MDSPEFFYQTVVRITALMNTSLIACNPILPCLIVEVEKKCIVVSSNITICILYIHCDILYTYYIYIYIYIRWTTCSFPIL